MSQYKLYTCILFFSKESSQNARKYRNVSCLRRFYLFAQLLGGEYFNVYCKKDKSFVERVYIKKAG
jgi:hypothetical protein